MSDSFVFSEIYNELPKKIITLSELFPPDKPLYLVGGAVRDLLLGKTPVDWDFATDARPDEIISFVKQWADSLWTVGIKFGTVGVLKNNIRYEITTFRADFYTQNSRRPEVTFSDSIEDDLLRRDFTINAIAYLIKEKKAVDPFGGIKDLKEKLLRTPRDTRTCFKEDPLRMLRAMTLHANLGVELNPEIFDAINELGHLLKNISAERISAELSKILLSPKPSDTLRLVFYAKLFDYFLPEFSELNIEQPTGYHHKNVLEHTLMVVDNTAVDLELRLAALLHDIAKPKCRKLIGKQVHFYGHDAVGAGMARKILKRLKFSSSAVQRVSKLVEMHMRPHTYREGVWTDSAVRRFIRDAGDILTLLNQLTLADCTSLKPKVAWAAVEKQKELERQIEEVQKREDVRAIKSLLTGHEIMEAFKISPGPVVGKIQKTVLQKQIDGDIKTKEEAWSLAKKIYREVVS